MEQEYTVQEKRNLVSTLQTQEYEVYLWLRDAYSVGWIAETMNARKRDIQKIAGIVYKTLSVRDQRDLVDQYGVLDRPITLARGKVRNSAGIDDLVFSLAMYGERNY